MEVLRDPNRVAQNGSVEVVVGTGTTIEGTLSYVGGLRIDGTVKGDIRSATEEPGMVVIGENTYEAVKDLFECRSLGKATLKGKAKEVATFEVTGTKGAVAQLGTATGGA
jgi:hypothetical protein